MAPDLLYNANIKLILLFSSTNKNENTDSLPSKHSVAIKLLRPLSRKVYPSFDLRQTTSCSKPVEGNTIEQSSFMCHGHVRYSCVDKYSHAISIDFC